MTIKAMLSKQATLAEPLTVKAARPASSQRGSTLTRLFFPAQDTEPIALRDTKPSTTAHFIVDAIDICYWHTQPSIHPLLILLSEIATKGASFLCVFEGDLCSQLKRFTSEEALKKIQREIYRPALTEFPERFVEVKNNSIAYIISAAKETGSPIISMEKALRQTFAAQIPERSADIVLGQVKKTRRGVATVEVPALGISGRGFAQEPTKLWWVLHDLLKPQPKREELKPPIEPLDTKPQWDVDILTIKVYWKILGAESTTRQFTKIIEYYDRLSSNQTEIVYDIDRLKLVYDLKPDAIYLGLDEFEGYIVFHFNSKQIAVLECPKVGNALYLITGKWQELSQLNRTDLLERYPNHVSRLIHKGDWVAKLKESLG